MAGVLQIILALLLNTDCHNPSNRTEQCHEDGCFKKSCEIMVKIHTEKSLHLLIQLLFLCLEGSLCLEKKTQAIGNVTITDVTKSKTMKIYL